MTDKIIEILERFYLHSDYLSQLKFLGDNKKPLNIFNFLSDYIKYLGDYYLDWSGGNTNFDISFDSVAVSDYNHQRNIEEISFSRTYSYLVSLASFQKHVEIPEAKINRINFDELNEKPRLFEICDPLILYGTKKNYSRYFILDLVNYFSRDEKHKEAFDKMYLNLSKSIPAYYATFNPQNASPEDYRLFSSLKDLENYFSKREPESLYIIESYMTL